MGKKDKAATNGSAISESGVLDLTVEQYENAKKTKDYRNGSRERLPITKKDEGYEFVIDRITRDVSNGPKTAGAPKYRLEAICDDPNFPDHAGVKANLYFTAHGLTGGQYLKFLEVAGDLAVKDFPVENGKAKTPMPSQSEVSKWEGSRIKIGVDGYSAPYNDPTSDKRYADYSLVERIGGGAKKVKKEKIAK